MCIGYIYCLRKYMINLITFYIYKINAKNKNINLYSRLLYPIYSKKTLKKFILINKYMFSSVSISYTREGKCNKEGPRRCSERVTVVLRKTFYSAPRRGIIREFAGTITVPRGNRLCFLSAYVRTEASANTIEPNRLMDGPHDTHCLNKT